MAFVVWMQRCEVAVHQHQTKDSLSQRGAGEGRHCNVAKEEAGSILVVYYILLLSAHQCEIASLKCRAMRPRHPVLLLAHCQQKGRWHGDVRQEQALVLSPVDFQRREEKNE